MRVISAVLGVIFLCLLFTASITYAGTRILCASTTSTQNSGLYEYLLPIVERETGVSVDILAVGTGAALEIGKRGDADIVIVHAKDEELKLVKQGFFVNRYDVMYNDLVIVGPPDNPSGIAEAVTALRAFAMIMRMKNTPFVSRGDNSGTHKKELSIWKEAGLDPAGEAWYLEVGQGMGKTLRITHEKRAYTLTDRGTFLAMRDRDALDLRIVTEGGRELANQYGVMAVNPERHPHVKYKSSMKVISFLVSSKGQRAIGNFRDSRGNVLFYSGSYSCFLGDCRP